MFAFALALAFWAWSAFITFGAGLLGAALNCEHGCEGTGAAQWTKPWTLASHYVFPEIFFIAIGGLVVATVFAVLVRRRRPLPAAAALLISTLLLSYPFFAGLTSQGRRLFWWGPLVGAAALVPSLAGHRARAEQSG